MVSVPVVDVGDVVGEADACASVCAAAAALPPPAAAPPPLSDPPACEAGTVCTAGVVDWWPTPTTISGALARVATLVPPTSEPTITPNPSMHITAAAAARGPGIATPNAAGLRSVSANDSASGVPAGRSGFGPCSWIAPTKAAISGGSGPRRAPQSTQ